MTSKDTRSLRTQPRLPAAVILAVIAAPPVTTLAIAGGLPQELPGTPVTAQSQFGNGVVSGQVRDGSGGHLQVQLPSGTWIDCRSSCRETLRVETVDFWQAQNKTTNECGIFGCLQLRYLGR